MLSRASFPLNARVSLLNCLPRYAAASTSTAPASLPGRQKDIKSGFGSPRYGERLGSSKHTYQYLGMNLELMATKNFVSAPYALCFRSFIHSDDQTDFETGRHSRPMNPSSGQRDFEPDRNLRPMDFRMRWNSRPLDSTSGRRDFEPDSNFRRMPFDMRRNSRPMDFVRGTIEQDNKSQHAAEKDADLVVIKLLRNNTFISVMDSKGNKKIGMTAGWLQKQQGGGKLSRYSGEATAEHVGRVARELGMKSFVMKVNGFMFFKRKRAAIMSFKEGFTQSRSGENPIVCIEDTTRRPHNGCRLPKRRRI